MTLPRIAGAAALAVLCAVAAAPARADSALPAMFEKAKTLVKAGDFPGALAALDALDAESAKPGNEGARSALAPAAAFYRGVCLASLGRSEEARDRFAEYRAANPGKGIDRKAYSRAVVDAFEKSLDAPPAAKEASSSLAAAYRRTRAPAVRQVPLQDWASGPVKVLLTAEEIREFARLAEDMERAGFVRRFWCESAAATERASRREEFERRVAFADENFGEGATRGSFTDRGTAFLLLGPPSGVFRRPISLDRDRPATLTMDGGTNPAPRQSVGLSPSDQPSNWREVWRYNREELPAGLPFHQVELAFDTRTDYGTRVLQRDGTALRTLEAARATWRPRCEDPK